MTDPHDDANADDARLGPDRREFAGTPRWVKVFALIFLIVALLIFIMMFTRGPGGHGPRRHISAIAAVCSFASSIRAADGASADDTAHNTVPPDADHG